MSAYAIGPTPSNSGVASALNGATDASPAATSPRWTMIAMIAMVPWRSSGTMGIGGRGMTLAMADSSSGADSAAAMNPVTVSTEAGAGPGSLRFGIDVDGRQVAQVEDQAAIGRALAHGAMATATDRELDPAVAREADDARDVIRVRHTGNRGRAFVEVAQEDLA